MNRLTRWWWPALMLHLAASIAQAQSFLVQCPTSTITHPAGAVNNCGLLGVNNCEPPYTAPTTLKPGPDGYLVPSANVVNGPINVNGAIKCQQISGGDGFAAMGDGTQ